MRLRDLSRCLVPGLFVISMQAIAAEEQQVRNLVALGGLAFADNCQHCHQIDGYGEAPLYPSLRDEALLANRALLVNTVLHGRFAKEQDGTRSEPLMPSLSFLSNREVAAIIAFITNTWGPEVLVVSEQEVADAR